MRLLPFSLAAILSPVLSAQTVWAVPDGQDIDPFIAQANPGDIVLLGTSHPVFHLDKGLTILGRGADPLSGTYISGFSFATADIPAGQRAMIAGMGFYVWSATGSGSTSLIVYGGEVAIDDVFANSAMSVSGQVVMQRIEIASGGLGVGGLCELTDAVVTGRDFAVTFTSVLPPTPGIRVGGPNARLIASNVTAAGGVGGSDPSGLTIPYDGAPGLELMGGQAFVTDSALIGGGAAPQVAGGVALDSSGVASIARTSLTDAVGAVGVSSGYQQVGQMVGMHCPLPPSRGSTLLVTATAGDSQELLGIVGGFDRTANDLVPIQEPLFGLPSQLATLALAVPLPNATVQLAVPVPNIPALVGVEVWLQALQLAGSEIRASTVVGGVIR